MNCGLCGRAQYVMMRYRHGGVVKAIRRKRIKKWDGGIRGGCREGQTGQDGRSCEWTLKFCQHMCTLLSLIQIISTFSGFINTGMHIKHAKVMLFVYYQTEMHSHTEHFPTTQMLSKRRLWLYFSQPFHNRPDCWACRPTHHPQWEHRC